MPRRRVLTEAQLENLLALPTTETELVRYWTLGDEDLAIIGRRRRAHNRLDYGARVQTGYRQLDVLRAQFGFGDLAPVRQEILGWLLPVALATTSAASIAEA